MTFGELVRKERQRQGLSGQALALRAGISPGTLYALEHGQTQDPRLSLIAALCVALGLAITVPSEEIESPQMLRAREGKRYAALR